MISSSKFLTDFLPLTQPDQSSKIYNKNYKETYFVTGVNECSKIALADILAKFYEKSDNPLKRVGLANPESNGGKYGPMHVIGHVIHLVTESCLR